MMGICRVTAVVALHPDICIIDPGFCVHCLVLSLYSLLLPVLSTYLGAV